MGKASNDPWRRWRLATSDAGGRWLGPAVLVTREREGKGPVQVGGAGARALALYRGTRYPSVASKHAQNGGVLGWDCSAWVIQASEPGPKKQ